MKQTALILSAGIFFFCASIAQADILCPDPQDMLGVVPTDLAAVQDDIDRLSLCVKRTQLLKELNDLIEEQEKVDSLGIDDFPRGDSFLPALPSAPVIKKNEAINPALFDKIKVQETPKKVEKETKKAPKQTEWFINKIWGQSGVLKAQLISSDGQVSIASEGDILVSGHVVDVLAYDQVLIRKNDKTLKLSWYVSE